MDEINGASHRVLEKLGFARIATLPGAFGNMFRLRLDLGDREPIGRDELIGQLRALGVAPGGVLIVHTAFSKVGPVEGGPHGLIEALRAALGPDGTLVMPSMCEDDEHPFDPKTFGCRWLGVVADTFWRLPGVLRSDNPHAFAAAGPHAAALTAPHPVDVPHGPDSPPGRVVALDGQVLLAGVGHDANTTIHVAELMAGVRYRRPSHATILRDGRPVRVEYGENDCCCERFALVDGWLEAGDGKQRRGKLGNAEARLARSRDIVAAVTALWPRTRRPSSTRSASTPNATRPAPRCRHERQSELVRRRHQPRRRPHRHAHGRAARPREARRRRPLLPVALPPPVPGVDRRARSRPLRRHPDRLAPGRLSRLGAPPQRALAQDSSSGSQGESGTAMGFLQDGDLWPHGRHRKKGG